MMRSILSKKNKKAQGNSIIAFIVIVLGLLFLAPIIYKIVGTAVGGFGNGIASMSPVANQTAQGISNSFTGFLDTFIAIAFLVNVLVLLVTSFLVDVHPAFLILYILTAVFSLIFAPTVYTSLDALWNNSQFTEAAAGLPLTGFILQNFGVILLGVLVLSGIVMYAKFKFGGIR